MAAPDLGEPLEVDDAVVRVRRRLAEDEARRPPDGLLHPLVVPGGHRRDLDPVPAQDLVEELPGSPVRVVGHDDVGALGEHREERRGDGGHAAREQEALLGALQSRELPLRHALGGVAVPAVLVTLDAALEVVRDLLAVPERVRRGLDDRRRQRAGQLLARLAAVDRLRARARLPGGRGGGRGHRGRRRGRWVAERDPDAVASWPNQASMSRILSACRRIASCTSPASGPISSGRFARVDGSPGDQPQVVRRLLLRELQPVGGGDHDHALVRADDLPLHELPEGGQGDAGVRAVEHPGPVGAGRLVGELGLARLLDDPVELAQHLDGALVADRVADLDRAGERLLRLHRTERLEARQVREVEGIGVLGLGHRDAGQLLDEPERLHHEEALAERARVPEVAAGDDDPVRNLPVELLHELDGDGLLALDAEAVHGVGQVDGALLGDLLDQRHAPVEVRVQREDERPVRQRLHELRGRDLVAGQEDHGGDSGGGAVVRQRGRGVPGGRAGDGGDRVPLLDHLLDDRDQHGHPEVLEGPGVGVAALLDPEVLDPEHLAVAVRPQEVRASLVGRDDALVVEEGDHPLLLPPHAGPVGEQVPPVAVVEELHPGRGRPAPEGLEIVDHVEEVVARGTAVDDLQQAVAAGAAVDALEPGAVLAHDTHLSGIVEPPYRPTGGQAGSTVAGIRVTSSPGPGGLSCPHPRGEVDFPRRIGRCPAGSNGARR